MGGEPVAHIRILFTQVGTQHRIKIKPHDKQMVSQEKSLLLLDIEDKGRVWKLINIRSSTAHQQYSTIYAAYDRKQVRHPWHRHKVWLYQSWSSALGNDTDTAVYYFIASSDLFCLHTY